MATTLPKIEAQRRLAVLWLVMALIPTALLGFNTLQGRFTDPSAVWQWFSPFIFPTLLLIIGTLRTAETMEGAKMRSSTFYFRLCWWLSFFYWICVWSTLAMGIHHQATESRQLLDSLEPAGLLLTGVQSLLNLALGAFFVAPSAE